MSIVLLAVAEPGIGFPLPESIKSLFEPNAARPELSVRPVVARLASSGGLQLDVAILKVGAASAWATSWSALSKLDDVDLVHVVRPGTPAGEMLVVAAKALGKLLVLSHVSEATSRLGISLGMLTLADSLVVGSEEEAKRFQDMAVTIIEDSEKAAADYVGLYGAVIDSVPRE